MKELLNSGTMISFVFLNCKKRRFNFNKSELLMDERYYDDYWRTHTFTADFRFDKEVAHLFIGTKGNIDTMRPAFDFNISKIVFNHDQEIEKVTGSLNEINMMGTDDDINNMKDPHFSFYFNNHNVVSPLEIEGKPYGILEIEGYTYEGEKRLYQYIFNTFQGIFGVSKVSDTLTFVSDWERIINKSYFSNEPVYNFKELMNYYSNNRDSLSGHLSSPLRKYEINDNPDYPYFPIPVKTRALSTMRTTVNKINELFTKKNMKLSEWDIIMRTHLMGDTSALLQETEKEKGKKIEVEYYVNNIVNNQIDADLIFRYGVLKNSTSNFEKSLFIECNINYWSYIVFLVMNILNEGENIRFHSSKIEEAWQGLFMLSFKNFTMKAFHYDKRGNSRFLLFLSGK
ncbi:MAG: hypothetical protein DRI89_09180 [Bacteroidetes bacterium]|nr:MAG: hypothetical protein DRI89_09180 [Bacteroidota bacterium]